MGRRGPESFMKRQKELKRRQKAQEKMARRQGKRKQQQEQQIAGIDREVVDTDKGQEGLGADQDIFKEAGA
jgi:hypothetical protein